MYAIRSYYVQAIETVVGLIGGQHRLAYPPCHAAALGADVRQVADRLHGAGLIQRVDRGGDDLVVGGLGELALLAAAYQQNPVGQGVGHVVQSYNFV